MCLEIIKHMHSYNFMKIIHNVNTNINSCNFIKIIHNINTNINSKLYIRENLIKILK